MEWYVILIISVIAFLIAFYFLVGFILARFMAYPGRVSREFGRQVDIDKKMIDASSYEGFMPTTFKMKDGMLLHGEKKILDPKRYVIIVHGYKWNLEGSRKYSDLFQKLGYSIIIYDHRGQGDNPKAPITMGYRECQDLLEIISQIKKEAGNDAEIVLHGESMGAATVCLALKEKPPIKYAVADCPYSSLKGLLKEIFRGPKFFLSSGYLWTKILYHYSVKDIEPKEAVKDNVIPLLLMHGENDGLVNCHHSLDIYENNKGMKRRFTFPGADHAVSLESDRARYEEELFKFDHDITNDI
ncbi:MAG: alpha/beta fold hydrolase [Bacilli bacterium]|nr:alpha/beta fold hydrolase [Bacilli bacterium]